MRVTLQSSANTLAINEADGVVVRDGVIDDGANIGE
jgi:hypothetical protein